MKAKITRKDIIDYRRIAKQEWHDQKWHDTMNSPKFLAINYAIGYMACDKNRDRSYSAISEIAEKFMSYNAN